MKKIKVLFFIVLAAFSANAQNLNLRGEKVLESDTILNRLFSDYKTYLLSFSESIIEDTFKLNLILGDDYSWKIELFKNNMRTEGFKSYLTTEKGRVSDSYKIKTFKGFLNGNPKNSVRLSFYNNTVEGFLKVNENEIYYIVPIERILGANDRAGTVIIVKGKDFKEELYPANDAIISEWDEPSVTKSINYSNPVRIIRIAVEGDYEFYQNHSYSPISDIESIINMAEDVYESSFNIIFRIVHINVYTTSNDPFTEEFTYVNRGNVLSELASHFSASHSDVYRDVAYLFTGKPTDSIAGVAYQPGYYGAVRALSSTSYKTFAHELGHNFNGDHLYGTNCGTDDASVMCQGIKKVPLYFSSANISRINSNISSRLITYSYVSDGITCNYNNVFSVSNIPSGFTVSWPKSSNLTFSGISTGSPVIIVAPSDGTYWVQPTLSRGLSSNTVSFPEDYFWVGKPDFYISGDYQLSTYEPGIASILTANENLELQQVTDYDWSYVGPLSSLVGGTVIASYRAASYGGVGTIYAELTNGCGSNEEQMIFYVEDDLLLSISPNPTSGETTLTIETTSEEAELDENEEWTLEIYDNIQNLKLKNNKLKDNSTKIQTASWKEGVYIVRVKYKDEVLTGKLVVKK